MDFVKGRTPVQVRKVLFWLHLSAGLTAGVVIVIMSVTGTLLMYEKQIAAWADGYRVKPPSGDAKISIEGLLKKVSVERPGATPTTITLSADRTRPAAVNLGRDGLLFLDPFTAEVFGPGAQRVRAFFRSMTDWHRWLARQGEERATGRAATGAANLVFLFIVLSGLYLWWPKTWSRASLRSIVFLRGDLSGKARDFNWHNAFGFWAALPLFFVVLSAVTISYPWANDLLYKVTGNEAPPRPAGRAPAQSGPRPSRSQASPVPAAGLDTEGFDGLLAVAVKHTADWQTISLRLPASSSDPVTFAIDTSTGAARPDLRSQLVLNRSDGSIIRHETYASQNAGRKLRSWARWVHTGEAFGVAGQTIAGLASAIAVILAWTGVALSWRRFRAFRARGTTRS